MAAVLGWLALMSVIFTKRYKRQCPKDERRVAKGHWELLAGSNALFLISDNLVLVKKQMTDRTVRQGWAVVPRKAPINV